MNYDYKEIWLECACGERHGEERHWGQDNAWEGECDQKDCKGPVRYVRADIAEAQVALIAELAKALEHYAESAAVWDDQFKQYVSTNDDGRRARAAIARAKAVQG